MQQKLIFQLLNTLSTLCQSEQIGLYSVKQGHVKEISGGMKNQKFVFLNKPVVFRGILLEEVLLTKKIKIYPCSYLEGLPFPSYNNIIEDQECLCLPLMNAQQRVILIATIAQLRGTGLSEQTSYVLKTMGGFIATTLEIAEENIQLYELATIDSLTNLYTRRYFEIRLQEESSRVRRHGGVISLIMIDIDNFKYLNDSCGYEVGNKVLQDFSKLLSDSIRKEIDLACRYNGTQFVVLLPNTDIDGAYTLGERIRRRCEHHNFTTIQGVPIKVTISIGIANNIEIVRDIDMNEALSTLGQKNELSKEELLHRADLMLYAAKQAGKNRVMVWW